MSKFHLIKIILMTLMCASFSTLCLAEPNNPQSQAATAAQELEPAPVVVKKNSVVRTNAYRSKN